MKKYINLLKEGGATWVKEIDPASIITAPWTRYKCQFGCDFYGKSYCCPPNTPDYQRTQEMIDCYKRAILFRCPEMKEDTVTHLAVKTARELFLDGYYKAIAFGCGPCLKCGECNLLHCNFPKETVPAMEACGIDVFATARLNGAKIETVREKEAEKNYFGLLLVE